MDPQRAHSLPASQLECRPLSWLWRGAGLFILCGSLLVGSGVSQEEPVESFSKRLTTAFSIQKDQGPEQALALFSELAEEARPDAESSDPIAWIYYIIPETSKAVCLLQTGRWKESVESIEAALKFENDLARTYWAHLHAIAAQSYLKGGLLKLALPHIEKATSLSKAALESARLGAEEYINKTGYGEAHIAAAKYILATTNSAPAEKILMDLLEVRFPDGKGLNPDNKGTVMSLLGATRYRLYFEGVLRSDQPALDAYADALALGGALEPRDRFSALARTAHLHLEGGRLEEAEAILDSIDWERHSGTINEGERAWYFSLRNRVARELHGAAFDPFGGSWQELLGRMQATQRVGGIGHLKYLRLRVVGFEAIMQTLNDGGLQAGLDTLLRFQQIGFLHDQLKPEPIDSKRLAAHLAEDELCLIFFPGHAQIQLFAIDHAGLIESWLVPRSFELLDKVDELATRVFQAPGQSRNSWQTVADELRDVWLPEGLQKRLANSARLRLIGRENIRNPLVEVFQLNGVALGLSHAISDSPSAAVGVHLQGRAKQRYELQAVSEPLDWLLIADPNLTEEAAALAQDTSRIDVPFPAGDRIRTLRREAATLESWLNGQPSQVLQLLSHGLQTLEAEWSAKIALSQDAKLPSGLLSGLDLLQQDKFRGAPLAILSICRGQAGVVREGDPGAGRLAGAFLAKGSQAVLTSREDANVYLQPTQAFQLVVRQALAEGARLDDAVLAGRQALAGGAHTGEALHWAAWQVLGTGALQLQLAPELKLAGEKGRNLWLWAGLGLLAAMLAIGWRSRSVRRRVAS